MPLRGVSSYREATKMNNSLSVANSAYKLIDAGFGEQARDMLIQARQQPDHHPNVDRALSDLVLREEAEDKKRDRALERAEEERVFVRRFADAMYSEPADRPTFEGRWRGAPDHRIRIDVKAENLKADLVFGEWDDEPIELEAFNGVVLNRAATITAKHWPGDMKSDVRIFIFLSDDGKKIHAMGRAWISGDFMFQSFEKDET